MAKWQDPIVFAIYIGIIVLVLLALVFAIIIFTSLYFKKIIKGREKLAKAEIQYQKSLLESSVLVQEKERSRVAGELHDGLVSRLNVLNMALRMNSRSVDPLMVLDECIKMARGISHDLHPPMLEEMSIVELIKAFIMPLKDSFEINFTEKVYNNSTCLKTDIKLHLLRIVQEVTNNVIKHSKASRIVIFYRQSFRRVSLTIIDNGIGFDVDQNNQGLGLKNLEMRTQLISGRYKIKSKQENGTTFIFSMIINPKYDSNEK